MYNLCAQTVKKIYFVRVSKSKKFVVIFSKMVSDLVRATYMLSVCLNHREEGLQLRHDNRPMWWHDNAPGLRCPKFVLWWSFHQPKTFFRLIGSFRILYGVIWMLEIKTIFVNLNVLVFKFLTIFFKTNIIL